LDFALKKELPIAFLLEKGVGKGEDLPHIRSLLQTFSKSLIWIRELRKRGGPNRALALRIKLPRHRDRKEAGDWESAKALRGLRSKNSLSFRSVWRSSVLAA